MFLAVRVQRHCDNGEHTLPQSATCSKAQPKKGERLKCVHDFAANAINEVKPFGALIIANMAQWADNFGWIKDLSLSCVLRAQSTHSSQQRNGFLRGH